MERAEAEQVARVEPSPGAGGAPPARAGGALASRSVLLAASGATAVALAALVALLPVPYAVMTPGPVRDVLGEVDGEPLISISGAETYPTEGQLDLTTVSVFGGPGNRVDLLQVVEGWFDDEVAVVPEESVFPPTVSQEDVDARNQAEMVSSQEAATAAALAELGYDLGTALVVAGFSSTGLADGALAEGDVIDSVDGAPVADLEALREALQRREPGETAQVGVERDGEEVVVGVELSGDADATQLGVLVDPRYDFPVDVRIAIEDIGGPSAGTIFALGIIDLLTPGSLTGGEHVAGTGTIDAAGQVGPIGGIQQKLVGARDDGAEWFLAPAGNCDDVRGAVPDGLSVVRIDTLADARAAVEAIGSGEGTGSLPRC